MLPSSAGGTEFTLAMQEVITMFADPDMDETWTSLNCAEADTLAEVLILGGALIGQPMPGARAARAVIGQHATRDEPGDVHYFPVGQAVTYTAGLRAGLDATITEANDGIGIVTIRWEISGGEEPAHVIDLEVKESPDAEHQPGAAQ